MKRSIFILALALAAAFLLPQEACVPHNQKVIHVATFLNDPVLIKIDQEVIEGIEKKYPGLQIDLQIIPYNNYQEKLATLTAAGAAPDVIDVETNDFVDLYLRGMLEDLGPYIQGDKLDMKDYYPGVLGRFSPDGHIFALPQDTAPEGLIYYNKKIFQDAGVPFPTNNWSWPKDFLPICQKLVKKDADGHVVRWAYTEAYPIMPDDFILSNGGNWVDNTDHPTRLTMDDPKAMEAIQFRWDLMFKYHVSPSIPEMQAFNLSDGVEQMFMDGKVAMMCSGIWHTPKLLQAKDLDFDVVEFPKGPTGIRAWGSGGSGYAMSKTCKDKESAWLVIKELGSVDTLTKLCGTGMIQPALMSLANSDVFLKSPGPAHKGILLEMPKYSHYQPFMANWGEIQQGTLGPAMDPVWLGNKMPGEVLPGITKTINERFFNQK